MPKMKWKLVLVLVLSAVIGFSLEYGLSSVLSSHTFNSSDYTQIIEQLKAKGYSFQTLDQPYINGKVVYLIHCADYSFKGAATFQNIESQEGIKSTFMIRPDSTFFPQTISAFLKLQSEGWKLGYEYDCLSRADNNMTLAVLMFQAQVTYLRALGLNLVGADAHGDIEYNNTIDSNQIFNEKPSLFNENKLVPIFHIPNFEGYQYFSDSSFHKIVLPNNLSDKIIIETHTDWY